jgi:prepilin peptidase CpaA
MPLELHLVPLAGFAGLMAAAAVEDLRRLVIPNPIVVGLCVLWPLHLAAAPSFTLAGSGGAAACAVAVFLAGALLFSHGLMGGGDVKLLAAATLWAGPGGTPALLVVTAVLGGVLSLVLLSSACGPLSLRLPPRHPGESGAGAVRRGDRRRRRDRDDPAKPQPVASRCAHAL